MTDNHYFIILVDYNSFGTKYSRTTVHVCMYAQKFTCVKYLCVYMRVL